MLHKTTFTPTIILAICFFFVWSFACSSCADKEGLTPAFLQIDTVKVMADVEDGTSSHNIRMVQVAVNAQSIGFFEPPVSIPILSEGSSDILILAGIASNGISSLINAYPHYTGYETTVNLTPGESYNIEPTFSYKQDAIIPLNADFELGNSFQILEEAPSLELVTSDVFEGARSARVRLDELNDAFTLTSIEAFELPSNFRFIHVEMNYKCTASFELWLRSFDVNTGDSDIIFIAGAKSRDFWNKIYFDLSAAASQMNNAGFTRHQLVIRGSLPSNETNATFLWDNIKLVHELP